MPHFADVAKDMLAGQVAVVTGASSGIGRACALTLAAAGARVVVNHFRDGEAAAAVAREIGAGAFACEADVSDEAGSEEALFPRQPRTARRRR